MAQVKLDRVWKMFGQVEAVRDFSLEISDGEFIILVGPSGCGKTTLLRIIAGLEDASSGEIYIDGNPVLNVPPKKRDIAMVFQNYALYPHMNVYDNLAFCLKLRRMSKGDIKAKVGHTAELLGLGQMLERKPNQLSGGQRQRVALGRAIIRDPKVFLFDEPLSNLDAKLRVAMRTELLELHQRLGNTAVYVTHDQLEAMTMGSRIVVMKDGLIQQVGPPRQVYDAPVNMFVAGFIGSPAMNFILGRLESRADLPVFTAEGLELSLPLERAGRLSGYKKSEVVLGLRAEHVVDREGARDFQSGSAFRARIRLIEPLGAEQLVHLAVGPHRLTATLDPRLNLNVGQEMEFKTRLESISLFDPESGQALG